MLLGAGSTFDRYLLMAWHEKIGRQQVAFVGSGYEMFNCDVSAMFKLQSDLQAMNSRRCYMLMPDSLREETSVNGLG